MFKIPPPKAPDCETKPMLPRCGSASANVASILKSGCVFKTPKQFGPTHLIPYSLIFLTSSFSA